MAGSKFDDDWITLRSEGGEGLIAFLPAVGEALFRSAAREFYPVRSVNCLHFATSACYPFGEIKPVFVLLAGSEMAVYRNEGELGATEAEEILRTDDLKTVVDAVDLILSEHTSGA